MTTLAAPAGGALRWALVDSWTIARAELLHWVRNPSLIASSVAFPVMFVLLFGFVFGSAIAVPGGGDYREFLMPGMFAQAMVSGAAATVAVVAANRALGVTDRYRSMPVARSAPLIGRSLADMVGSVLDLVVLVACGLLVGWTTRTGVASTLAAVGLLLLLRFAMIWVGISWGSSSARRPPDWRGRRCSPSR
jgi:ABC-2 type transport system permease protein